MFRLAQSCVEVRKQWAELSEAQLRPPLQWGLHSVLTWRRDVFQVGGSLSAVARKDGYEEKKESKHNI